VDGTDQQPGGHRFHLEDGPLYQSGRLDIDPITNAYSKVTLEVIVNPL